MSETKTRGRLRELQTESHGEEMLKSTKVHITPSRISEKQNIKLKDVMFVLLGINLVWSQLHFHATFLLQN